jgi:Na+(H+)/acetate symporter ActP
MVTLSEGVIGGFSLKLTFILFVSVVTLSVVVIGTLVVLYVALGGMPGATFIQIVKAVMLIVGGPYLHLSSSGTGQRHDSLAVTSGTRRPTHSTRD